MASSSVLRVAAVGDVHCARNATSSMRSTFHRMAREAEVILLCGDLTDYGLPEEAHLLVHELQDCHNVPVLAVLGNHDFESGKQDEVRSILCDGGITVLDGDSCEIAGVGFAGTKGFGGGFGDRALQPWGEDVIKAFVREAVNEAVKLEEALARLHTEARVVVLHYSPIEATVQGEPCEIYPFLGSRRLEEPVNRFHVTAVVHGHAHHGQPEGRTETGVPVYNVARPLLQALHPNGPPYRLLEVPVTEPAGAVN